MSFPSKLTVGSTFGIYPPRSGGQMRVFNLCRQVAARYPVDVIALVAEEEFPIERELAPGLNEIRVPKSAAHVAAEAEFAHKAGIPITDVVFPELHRLTPEFAAAVVRSTINGGALVAAQPYTLPALIAAGTQLPLWYDVHNVEVDLKASMLARDKTGRRLLKATREVERACCEQADWVLAPSKDDADRLQTLYSVPAAKLALVRNGVDTKAIGFEPPAGRRRLRARLRLPAPLALFIGSWHEPNLHAARFIAKLALSLPEVEFGIVGSVCLPMREIDLPTNMTLFGTVADEMKQVLLKVAAVAINPMSEGSGTNIKMLDYMAAGVPVVSTVVGARGLELDPVRHVRIAPLEQFARAVRGLLEEPEAEAERRARAARQHVEERFDWEVVARQLLLATDGSPLEAGDSARARDAPVP